LALLFDPKFVEEPPIERESHSHREAVRKLERGGRSFGRRIAQLEGSTHKKEDTVGSVTMINNAMSSTLMG
jgi:hypothetical protein